MFLYGFYRLKRKKKRKLKSIKPLSMKDVCLLPKEGSDTAFCVKWCMYVTYSKPTATIYAL